MLYWPQSSEFPDVYNAALASERAARDRIVSDLEEGSHKRMDGEDDFINAMEESTARMDDLSGVGGGSNGGNIIPDFEADLSELDERLLEARLGYPTDQEHMASGVVEPLLGLGLTDTVSADEVWSFIIYECHLVREITAYSEDRERGGEEYRTYTQQAYLRRPSPDGSGPQSHLGEQEP